MGQYASLECAGHTHTRRIRITVVLPKRKTTFVRRTFVLRPLVELVAQAIRRRQVYLLPYMEWDWDCEVEGDLGERQGCFQPDDSYISTWTPIAQEKDTQPHVSSFKSTDDEKADAHGFRGSLESNECIVCIYALTTICLHCETSS